MTLVEGKSCLLESNAIEKALRASADCSFQR